jgi:hypothetical protein
MLSIADRGEEKTFYSRSGNETGKNKSGGKPDMCK